MSQHPSLRVDSVGIKHRNVLKRYERVKKMRSEESWKEGRSPYGLPKVKSIKVKIKSGGHKKDEESADQAGK